MHISQVAKTEKIDEKFDLLIYEMFFYPGYVIAEKLGIPCVRQFSQPAWNKEFIQKAPLVFRISAEIIDAKVMKKEHKLHMGLKHPIIYISLGSIISNKGFCKECIRAFGDTEFSVILKY